MQSLWRTAWRFLKKLKIESPYDPTIPLLGICPKKTIIRKDTCTPMFISVLFTIAKAWKQPKYPLTDEWIKKMQYIYTMEYYSAIKKNEMMQFAATWMDLEIIILSKVSQKEKDKYHMISLTCGIKNMMQMNLVYETETGSETWRADMWLPRGSGDGIRMHWEFGINRCKLLYIESINNRVLLYSTGNYI